MTTKNTPLIFFGNERLCTGITSQKASALQMLLKDGYTVALVIVRRETSRSRTQPSLEIEQIARRFDIPVVFSDDPDQIARDIKKTGAQAGILAAYGRIIPEQIINLFEYGIINIHPSLLPLYRGSTPIEQTILDGPAETGISLMRLTKGMDEGPLFAQRHIGLDGHETKFELAERLLEEGGKLLLETLPVILNGTALAVPQDHAKATYTKLITKQDGAIDWQKPAFKLEREIRAYLGWPGSFAVLANRPVIITKAKVIASQREAGQVFVTDKKELAVGCAQDSLVIELLKPAGKREMTGQEFLAGHRIQ